MHTAPACYGEMFPDVLHLPDGRAEGKVFSVVLERAGGLWRSSRSIVADTDQWNKCRGCPEFDHCYKFCMAKLVLASGIFQQ